MPTKITKIAVEGRDIDDIVREQLTQNGFNPDADSLSAMYSSATQKN